jgi:hypothetical protein
LCNWGLGADIYINIGIGTETGALDLGVV